MPNNNNNEIAFASQSKADQPRTGYMSNSDAKLGHHHHHLRLIGAILWGKNRLTNKIFV